MAVPLVMEESPTPLTYQTSEDCSTPSLSQHVVDKLHDAEDFLCGGGAAIINISVTFPLNKIMFRQMIQGVKTSAAVEQIRHEGFRYLYRGVLPPLLQKTTSLSLMFGSYGHTYSNLSDDMPHVACVAIAGIVAGSAEAVLTPLERIQTLLQDQHNHKRFHNTWHTAKALRHYGIKEYYRGVTAVLFRNGPGNVMFFGFRDPVKKMFPPTDLWYCHLVYDFASGALLGAVIGTLFYPFNVLRANMQTRVGGDFPSMRQVFWEVFEDRGRRWSKLYYGVHLNYTRAFISWGIINASYELLRKMFGVVIVPK